MYTRVLEGDLKCVVHACNLTHVAICVVEQVFDPAASNRTYLVTQLLFDDDVTRLLSCQQFIDVLGRAHGVHLIRLQQNYTRGKNKLGALFEVSVVIFSVVNILITNL